MKNNSERIKMKKNILFLLMPLLFFMATDAYAQEGCDEDFCCYEDNCCVDERDFYAKFLGGVNFLQKIDGNNSTYKTGYIIAGSLGYCWCNGVTFGS